jgi:hypothetical protein
MKITFLFLAAFLVSISINAQDLIEFSFNGQRFSSKTFEQKAHNNGASELVLSAFQNKPPLSPTEMKNYKTGIRWVLSIDNLTHGLSVSKKDTLVLRRTHFDHYKNFGKISTADANAINAIKAQGDASKKRLKSKEEKIKALTQKVINGDQKAIKELEKLVNEEASALESGVPDHQFKEESKQTFFVLTLFAPYKNGKYEYEIEVTNCKLTIYELNKSYVYLRFNGKANMFYDEWDKEAKAKEELKSNTKIFDKIFKESGAINGLVKINFN